MRTRFGLLGGVLVLLLGAGIAALAYQAGVSQGAASAASAGSVVVVGGGPWGFGIFGILFGLFFLFILARIVIGVTFGAFGRGRGPWGHGSFMGRRAWMDSSAGGPGTGVGSALVSAVDGDYFNVVGLPVPALLGALADFSIMPFSWLQL